MSNLIDIQGQIEKLQKQAADIKSREYASTVQDILSKMEAFGITTKDLDAGKRRGAKGKGKLKAAVPAKRAKSAAKKPASAVAPKFRGPNGETWSGRGLTPRWLTALVAEGKTKESFAITE